MNCIAPSLENAVWTVPGSRMKMKKEHRVPLCARASEIVREMVALNSEHLFPNSHKGISHVPSEGLCGVPY